MNPKQRIIDVFNLHKNQWIKTNRSGDECLGNTFEDLLGVDENNHPIADYHGIEIKTLRTSSNTMMTLFSEAPLDSNFSNSKLKDLFGYYVNGVHKLYSTVGIKGTFNKKSKHFFYLELDETNSKLFLKVKENKNSTTVNSFYQVWDFNTFSNAIDNKLSHIALISGKSRGERGNMEVYFETLEFITGFNFNRIIEAIKNNHLKLDLRLGQYMSGPSMGKTHDHGSGFRIKPLHLRLYSTFELFK